ncbi:efflux RND transporter periplasmic adaptor subunit [Marinimicrobium sp. ABcell2]|uniref:efflux RND transporter periplasmic adaptor subunit n=1 Tax=Marinimicrobium sp. ABcell2 TaxID=3069751 RepID=UPI0027B63C66|nr:efflux RND transporter periplasmic adaptor subunit [Marinimicrobium sp. ABcell2]MDQ2077086.1 efflux RND transporter periplasmic adaptor subunit [Marinimicrobium sp. ABcell2]
MTIDFSSPRVRLGLLAAVVVLVLILLWRLLAPGDAHRDHVHRTDDAPPQDQTTDAELSPQQSPGVNVGQTLYTCSMHPQVRSTDPDARCPICGMALIPVATDEHDHDDSVAAEETPGLRLSPRAIALSNIRTAPVEYRAITATLSLPGRVDYDETRQRVIAARMAGRLDTLHVNFTGAQVEAGDPLVEIYSPELISAQEELLQAARRLPGSESGALGDGARMTYQAARERLRLLGVSTQEIAAIEERGEVRDQLRIHAPMNGLVVTRHSTEGEYVNTGDPLFTLADLSRLWVQLEAYERDLNQLAVGQPVHVQLSAHPGETYEGQITFIQPRVDEARRTAQVRVEVANPEGRLKPGMLAQGLVQAEQPTALVIPASAPLLTGTRALVYVQDPTDDQRFRAREVTLGARLGDHYQVRSGLAEGERVVSHGAFRIDSELQIRGMPSMMAPEGNGAPAHDHGNGNGHEGHGGAQQEDTDHSNHGHHNHGHDHHQHNHDHDHDHYDQGHGQNHQQGHDDHPEHCDDHDEHGHDHHSHSHSAPSLGTTQGGAHG